MIYDVSSQDWGVKLNWSGADTNATMSNDDAYRAARADYRQRVAQPGYRRWGVDGQAVRVAEDGSMNQITHAEPVDSPMLEALSERVGPGPQILGYGSAFGVGYMMRDMFGPYLEVMSSRAFTESLRVAALEMSLLVNHTGLGLATMSSGRMAVDTDAYGLAFAARLDLAEADAAALFSKLQSGSATTEASIGGWIESASWNDDYSVFTVDSWALHRGEISVVNTGANPAAWAVARDVVDDVIPFAEAALAV